MQHAVARHATLTVEFLPQEVILDVVDDGRGFDAVEQPAPDGDGGFGLAAMRSRARELGGSLTVETSPGDGTAVAARLPAPRLDDAAQVVPVSGTAHREDV
mgnify:FL=1